MFRQALRILLRALAAETPGAGQAQEWQSPGLQFQVRDSKRRPIPFQLFGMPKNSKSPVQHVCMSNKDQDNLRGSINSNPRHPSLHSCRQGASCHPVVPCWLHAHAECVRRRLCFCSNRQSDPSVPIGQLTRLRLI